MCTAPWTLDLHYRYYCLTEIVSLWPSILKEQQILLRAFLFPSLELMKTLTFHLFQLVQILRWCFRKQVIYIKNSQTLNSQLSQPTCLFVIISAFMPMLLQWAQACRGLKGLKEKPNISCRLGFSTIKQLYLENMVMSRCCYCEVWVASLSIDSEPSVSM